MQREVVSESDREMLIFPVAGYWEVILWERNDYRVSARRLVVCESEAKAKEWIKKNGSKINYIENIK